VPKLKSGSGRKASENDEPRAVKHAVAVSAAALNVSEQAVRHAWERAGLLKRKSTFKPTELWKNRDKSAGENAPDFLKRVYAKWIGKGLTTLELRHADYPLYLSIAAHKSRGTLNIDLRVGDGG
jgi:hypothetical protein